MKKLPPDSFLTKEQFVSDINCDNNSKYVRSSYESMENNIGLHVYNNLLTKIKELYFSQFCDNKEQHYFAIDGTYNLNYNYELCLDKSVYDVVNGVPISINHEDRTRNGEIKSIKQVILNNLSLFNNKNIIFDRLNNYKIVSKDFKKLLTFLTKNRKIKQMKNQN